MYERINISLNPEVAKQLRLDAIEKYGNLRSMSKLIEDLIAEYHVKPDIEAIEATRTEYEAEFNKTLDDLIKSKKGHTCGMGRYRSYKCEVCGTEFDMIPVNVKFCPACCGPNPKYVGPA